MILEMALCLVHSPPGVNLVMPCYQGSVLIYYSLDMFCTFFTLARVYLFWRYFAKYSPWTNNEKAETICKECLCEGGISFAIKCELKERPYTIIMVAIGLSIVIFGYAMRAAEL